MLLNFSCTEEAHLLKFLAFRVDLSKSALHTCIYFYEKKRIFFRNTNSAVTFYTTHLVLIRLRMCELVLIRQSCILRSFSLLRSADQLSCYFNSVSDIFPTVPHQSCDYACRV